MRTICGFIGDDDRNLLKKMTTHSDSQMYIDEGFSVSAPQIAVDVQGTVIAFNGAIYNKQEISSQTEGDAEALLKLYRENGEKFIEKINGSFSLAVWDPEKGLILGRDRNGEKNLYHSTCGGRLLFSSRITQLFQYKELEKAVSLDGMTNFFAWGHIPTIHTLFRDIYKIPAASVLTVKGKSHSTAKYWDLEIGVIDNSRTEDEWVKQIYSIIEDSIRRRLDTGTHGVLIGGIDSSAIAAILKKEDQDIKSFTVYFSEEKNNEPYAKKTAEYLELDHYEDTITPEQVIREFPNIITALENPTADMNATIPTYFGYKLAHENGVNTLFTGDGADLAFWGNPPCNYILEPATQVRLYYMTPLPIRAFLHKFLRSMNRVNGVSTKRYQNIERIIRKLDPRNPLPYYLFFNEEELSHIVPINEVDIYSELRSSILGKKYYLNVWDQERFLLKMAVTMGWGVPRLVDYSFYYDMAFQAPIMDFRVRELAAHIPSKLKVITEVDKYIFRKAIKNNNLLPDEIINQPKTAFGLSIRDVIMPFMFNRDMENYLQDIIDGISPDLKQYMDIGFIERCIKSGELKHKFALLIFSSWYDSYINN